MKTDIKVYSNCNSITLFVNNVEIATENCDKIALFKNVSLNMPDIPLNNPASGDYHCDISVYPHSHIENLNALNDLCHSLDKTRPTTMAQLTMVEMDSPLNKITDILSYNHYFVLSNVTSPLLFLPLTPPSSRISDAKSNIFHTWVDHKYGRVAKVSSIFPSVICWGISNEITIGGEDPELVENLNALNDLCHSLDKTRPTFL